MFILSILIVGLISYVLGIVTGLYLAREDNK